MEENEKGRNRGCRDITEVDKKIEIMNKCYNEWPKMMN